jgi:exosortase/archaeosortase family protein
MPKARRLVVSDPRVTSAAARPGDPLFGTLVALARPAVAMSAARARNAPRRRTAALMARLRRHPVAAMGLLLLALWPHAGWMARRLTDGSDEPWGVLAMVTVLALVARDARRLVLPSAPVLLASALLALGSGVALAWLPPLVAAAVGLLALALFLAHALPQRAGAALTTLVLLSLPIIASLQFYLGYPLRAATAQAAALLLAPLGIDAQPAGAALVSGQVTVLIDAPCAGIGMLWVGSYTAALLSYLADAPARRALLNALAAAAIVFAANVLRNVALFFPEAGLLPLPAWTHAAVGLAVFAVALIAIFRVTQISGRPIDRRPVPKTPASARMRALYVGACLVAAVAPVLPLDRGGNAAKAHAGALRPAIAWPTHFRGQPLTQLALTPVDARFASRFPGAIARFAVGREQIVLRHVFQATRQLHPAVDCFRAAGYAVEAPRASTADDGTRYACFVASREGGRDGGRVERLRVCERITRAGAEAAANADTSRDTEWTDVSAWYWAALRGGGPWWAMTVITPIDER